MDDVVLAAELSKILYDKFCEGITDFSKKHDGMPLHVAMHGLGCATFTAISNMALQTEISLIEALLNLQVMLNDVTLSLVRFYEDKDQPKKTH